MNTPQAHLRRFTRALALTLVVALPMVAAPSFAQEPEGWTDPPPVNGLHALMVFLIIPATLFIIITLLVLAPSFARGEHAAPASGEGDWFGGPGKGTAELESSSDTTPGAGHDAEQSGTGGASGRW